MTVRGLKRVIVSVADLGPALGLYRDALGFTEKYRADEVAMLGSAEGGFELLLHQRPPTPGLHGVAVTYVVDDVDEVAAAAQRAGATLSTRRPTSPGASARRCSPTSTATSSAW